MGWLPKERAADCANEYRQLKFASAKTIYPFIDQDRMRKVQASARLTPNELK